MRVLIVDLKEQKYDVKKVENVVLNKLIFPQAVTLKLIQELKLPESREYLVITRSPAINDGIPGSSIVTITLYRSSTISSICALGTLGLKMYRLGIDAVLLKNIDVKYAKVDVYEQDVKIVEEVQHDLDIKFTRDFVETSLITTRHEVGELPFDTIVLKVHVEDTVVHQQFALSDKLVVRRLQLVHKYSPISGVGRPIARRGIVELYSRLIGVELSESFRKVLSEYDVSRKFGCTFCMAQCLNVHSVAQRHVVLSRHVLYEHIIDDDVRELLSKHNVDSISTVQLLYMRRFCFPECIDLDDNVVSKFIALYTTILALGLCPLYAMLLLQDGTLRSDLLVQYLRYISELDVAESLLLDVGVRLRLDMSGTTVSIEDVKYCLDRLASLSHIAYVDELPKLQRLKFPVVQAALDIPAPMSKVLDIAEKCIKAGVKVVEAGTPLVKLYGVEIVRKLRELADKLDPEVVIFADTKTMDVGDLEARIMYRNGADIVAVMGLGDPGKVIEALFEAVKFNRCVLIDLMQVPDPIEYLTNLGTVLNEAAPWLVVCIHRGITEQLKGKGIQSDFDLIRKVREKASNVKLAIAGGLRPGTLREFVNIGVDILIVGAALYTSRNIEETARSLVQEIST